MSHDANLPENSEAERSVLRTLLINPERFADVREIIGPDDFYVRAHQLIFGALAVLADNPRRSTSSRSKSRCAPAANSTRSAVAPISPTSWGSS
jgi:hypothetical protein